MPGTHLIRPELMIRKNRTCSRHMSVRRYNVKTKFRTLMAMGVIALAVAMTFVAANWHIVEAGRRGRFD
jgi:uncharacterized membrane protein